MGTFNKLLVMMLLAGALISCDDDLDVAKKPVQDETATANETQTTAPGRTTTSTMSTTVPRNRFLDDATEIELPESPGDTPSQTAEPTDVLMTLTLLSSNRSTGAATCPTSVDISLRGSEAVWASVPGDRILDVLGRDLGSGPVGILSACGNERLVSFGPWVRDTYASEGTLDLGSPYLVRSSSEAIVMRWEQSVLVLRATPSPFELTSPVFPMPHGRTVEIDWAPATVDYGCVEAHRAVGLFISSESGERTPWGVDGPLIVDWVEDIVATASGDFALIEDVCTDDGSWSRLIVGTFNPATGEMLTSSYDESLDEQYWSATNHRGPIEVALLDTETIVATAIDGSDAVTMVVNN